ncbi:hypothetical protein B484DRAFT_401928 [Ochromonadaceae sp. CCMP2298]|nr:hypothetical protein B484DRAFT_401928 [Ochromonadaceae sp. CCMP2298]
MLRSQLVIFTFNVIVQAAPTQSTSPIHARQRFPSDSTGAPISLASDELDKVYSKWFYGLAIALIPVAFIQFSVAAAAFSIPTGGMGFLWAGLFTLITCVLALFTKNQ